MSISKKYLNIKELWVRRPVRVLNEETINQIAAGEVIENPASCVKELVENSIDAGAKEITIETKAGGKAFIRVVDDGIGMRRDDLFLAIERHATSKITSVEDLFSLDTLGFRGEAIASIASVSKLTITTRPIEGGAGSKLYAEGGKIIKIEESTRSQGTTVEISSLFFNVPVRKKFLKSVAQESTSIHKVLVWLALSHPFLVFRWIHDGREEFLTPGSDEGISEGHLETLLGQGVAESFVPFSFQESTFKVEGFLGKPSAHRPNRLGQYLFINGRPIYSPFISRVIAEGYGTALPMGRHPQFVLQVDMPGNWVDVNIHPQKREVRFVDQSKLRDLLLRCLEKRTEEKVSIPTHFSSMHVLPLAKEIKIPPTVEMETKNLPLVSQIKVNVVALVGHFLFVQKGDELYLINGKEGVAKLQEERMRKLYAENEIPPSQSLLLPHTLECPPHLYKILVEELPLLKKLGIGMRALSGSTFLIDALPPPISLDRVEDFLFGLAEEMRMAKIKQKDLVSLLIKKVSSSFSKTSLNAEVGSYLATSLLKCDNPLYTLGGVKIMRKITEKELEKWIGG
ncbi:MAG: DNA mismatch repair endonuclease MutL [Chlamydiia bacterium]|nr:DNA mismatch repair endonuclease MutL [Chlamydiia bacterium]